MMISFSTSSRHFYNSCKPIIENGRHLVVQAVVTFLCSTNSGGLVNQLQQLSDLRASVR